MDKQVIVALRRHVTQFRNGDLGLIASGADSCTVEHGGTLWAVPFTTDGSGGYAFGLPVNVERESKPDTKPEPPKAKPTAESGLKRVRSLKLAGSKEHAVEFDLRVIEGEVTTTGAPKYDSANGDYHIVVFTEGVNKRKRRIYTRESVESLPATGAFDNLQMFLDHDESEKPGVRKTPDIASVSTTSWLVPAAESDTGVAEYHAAVHCFDGLHRERMADPLYRKTIAVSMIADLEGFYGKAEEAGGELYQVITNIPKRHGIDWVTKAGARGRVAENDNPEENSMEVLKTLTGQVLESERPDLVKELRDNAVADYKAQSESESELVKVTAERDKLKAQAEESATANRVARIDAEIKTAVEADAFGIPADMREAVTARVAVAVKALEVDKLDGDKLKGEVETRVQAEADYINAAKGKPKPTMKPGERQTESDDDTNDAIRKTEEAVSGLLG